MRARRAGPAAGGLVRSHTVEMFLCTEMRIDGKSLCAVRGRLGSGGSKRRSGGGTKRFQLKREPAPPLPNPIKHRGDGKPTWRRKKATEKKENVETSESGWRETKTSISGRRCTKGSRSAAKLTQTNKFAFDKKHSCCLFPSTSRPQTHRVVCCKSRSLNCSGSKRRFFFFFYSGGKKASEAEERRRSRQHPRVAAPPTLIFLLLL